MKRLCSPPYNTQEPVVLKKIAHDNNNEDETDDHSNTTNDPISDVDEDDLVTGQKESIDFPTRLGKCEVCAALEARYTCPKCEVKTCCLNCVRIHKKELECDGIRDRTKFIPLKDMTKMDFMSDYYFLEECTRYVEDRKGDRVKRYTRYNCELPIHLYRLRQAAKDRKCTLKILVQNFERHKENTTYYDWKTKKIWWRIKWIFVNAGSLCYVDEKCLEDRYLRDLLEKYVNKESEEEVPEKRKLEYYQSKGVQRLKVLLKSEGIKKCKDRFYLLDVNKTLKENLRGKTLVEYPCIYISYEEDASGFDVIDSDEDVEAVTKQHLDNLETYRQAVLEKQRREKDKSSSTDEEEDANDIIAMQKLQKETRRKERQRKREEYESKQNNNFLFTDEQLMEVLSSTTEDEEDQDQ
ncbi:box C/D snoRNA protein 1 [Stomoxys calcitrans]|uniref:box C/D snoRNA protein 1 n=1 Tax=Stomoxys calcitrans TaxID=35570 RepID=UPI0027E3AF7B|nr:box C/D snoRNA protein 1 [Stomoxys calcitrans]XP_013105414.2 box C/D snoRNA protein 1 [Stomoxys calcitrans]XP_013105424.2 box C/D snoRNA protein 1 [Stomoxys calcitrans]XP_013105431.2 box C/D snoRNA protein 1 [Stomoxys calcitrans]